MRENRDFAGCSCQYTHSVCARPVFLGRTTHYRVSCCILCILLCILYLGLLMEMKQCRIQGLQWFQSNLPLKEHASLISND